MSISRFMASRPTGGRVVVDGVDVTSITDRELPRVRREAESEETLTKVAILATPLLQQTLARLGFERDSYTFPFFVHVLDGALSRKTSRPIGGTSVPTTDTAIPALREAGA